jgi:hypothetical protein
VAGGQDHISREEVGGPGGDSGRIDDLACPPNEGPLLGGVKPRKLPVGRALLCTRRSHRLTQTAHCPPGPLIAGHEGPLRDLP